MSSETPITRLVRILETAPPVPLIRQQVRIDLLEVMKLADYIACPPRAPKEGQASGTGSSAETTAAVDAVRQAVRRAYRIPLTEQVRLPANQAAALLEDLRRLDAV